MAKYRLGNEAETYAELVFVNNWLNPQREAGRAWFKTETMIMAKTLNLQTYDPSSEFKLREMFVQGGECEVLGWKPVLHAARHSHQRLLVYGP